MERMKHFLQLEMKRYKVVQNIKHYYYYYYYYFWVWE